MASKDGHRAYRERHKAVGLCAECSRPAEPNRKMCANHLAAQATKQRKTAKARRAKGLCSLCNTVAAPQKTLCEKHLLQMRNRANERNAERVGKGLCRQCSRPSELGQAHCLLHRRYKVYALPQPVRRALREARVSKARIEQDRQDKLTQEFIERHLGLIDERSGEILKLRYGCNTRSHTLEEVGQQMGLTRERVRQIQEAAEDTITMFTIEKDVPVASNARGVAHDIRETLKAMEVGDSFVTPLAIRSGAIMLCARKIGAIVMSRKISDTERRVWLVQKPNANGDKDAT